VNVIVITPDGISAVSTADQFTYPAQQLNLVVTTTLDKLDATYDLANLSLREAIALANANPGADTISFDPSLDGGTISLSLGELAITDSVTIEGPSETLLAINGNSQSRIFDINDGNDASNINVEIDALTLTGGNAASGGAIYSTEDLSMDSVSVVWSTATNSGGGIYAGTLGDLFLQNCTISENTSTNGGGGIFVNSSGTTTIQNSTISGNSSSSDGGGLYVANIAGRTTTIQGCTISGNSAGWSGGGMWLGTMPGGTTTIQDSAVTGNSANAGNGGGIFDYSPGTTTIQNSTISGNAATVFGGGIFVFSSYLGTTTIQNSTITGNIADSDSDGVGKGGGLYAGHQTLSVASTIIAGNIDYSQVAPDVFGTVDLSNSLVGDNTGFGLTEAPVGTPDSNGNLIGGPTHGVIDPKLGPLADNGGPTQTCALLAGSPAIDTGSNPAGLAYDQRGSGYPRVLGTQADIGAYESTPVVAAPVVAAISPTSGPTYTGTVVTITGTNLAGATAVMFGNLSATIESDTATQIVVLAPAALVGMTVDVTVTTAGGTSPISSADRFTYIATEAPAHWPTVGVYDPTSSTFLLRNTNDSGFADQTCSYGVVGAGMLPIAGDWNGDGIESIGLYDPVTSTFYLRDTNCLQGPNDKGYADETFVYGPANAGYEPVVGDWNGDGRDTVGLYNPVTSTFYLRNSNSLQGPNDKGYADIVFNYGPANSDLLPLAGDWDGSGRDGIGLYSQITSTFYLRETTHLQGSSDHGYADTTFNYGAPRAGLLPLAGDWNGDGRDGIGVYDQSMAIFYLRNTIQLQGPSDHGYADVTFMYGKPNALQLPVAGNWTGKEIVTPVGMTTSGDNLGLAYAPSPTTVNTTTAAQTVTGSGAVTSGTLQLRNALQLQGPSDPGYADVSFTYGKPNALQLPVAGNGTGRAIITPVGMRTSGDNLGLNAPSPTIVTTTTAAQTLNGSDAVTTGTLQLAQPASTTGTLQLQAINARAVDQIDLGTVSEQQDLDALVNNLVNAQLKVDASRTDAALAS
jgi:parallel beta-helix repeat protein